MRNNREKMLKIDVHTIQTLQLLGPGVSTKDRTTVKGLVLSGAVFPNFTQSERSSIWKKMKKKDNIIPSLHTFFRNMRYLKSCADCMKRLVVFSKHRSTVKSAMRGIYKPADPASGECLIQTSETGFRHCLDAQADHADFGYRQLWLYAMRHYENLAKEPKRANLVAKPGCEKADETALYDMAVLAQKLGFDSPQITELINQSPDRQIARAVLLKARKPDRYRYGDIFESLVSTIAGCFPQATPIDYHATSEHIDGREVPLDARCGHPHVEAQKQDRQFLFIDPLHTNEFQTAGKISSLFLRRYVYFSFFSKPQSSSLYSSTSAANGPLEPEQPLSPLFVPLSELGDAMGENTSHEPRSNEGQNQDRQRSRETRRERHRREREQRQRRQQRQRRTRNPSRVERRSRTNSSMTSDSAVSVRSDASLNTPQRPSTLSEEVEDWMALDHDEPVHHGGDEGVTEENAESEQIEMQTDILGQFPVEAGIPDCEQPRVEEAHAAAGQAEQERLARETAERAEQEQLAREAAEGPAAERAEQERLAREAEERVAEERAEQERQAQEAEERAAAERVEQERLTQEAAERAEQERQAREGEEKAAAKRAEQERQAQEAAQRAAAEQAEQERLVREVEERAAAEQAEQERLAEVAERAEQEQQAQEAAQKAGAKQAEQERLVRGAEERVAGERAEQERQAQEAEEKVTAERSKQEWLAGEAAERAEKERRPTREDLTSITSANQEETTGQATQKDMSPRPITQLDFAAAQQPRDGGGMPATTLIPNRRPLEAISEHVAPQVHDSTTDISGTKRKEDVSLPPLQDGPSRQEKQALPANHEGRAGQGHQEDRNGDDAAEYVDEFLLEMLRNQAEHRALGEQSADNGSQLETEPSRNAEQEEGGRVVQERATALAQLQAETDNNSAPPVASGPLTEPSRRITRIDLLTARWRERRSQRDSDTMRLPRNARGYANQKQQRAKPDRIKKPRLRDWPMQQEKYAPAKQLQRKRKPSKLTPRAANRAAMRTAAVGSKLDDGPDLSRSAEQLAAIPGAESTADWTPLPSEADVAAQQGQSDRPAGELTENERTNVPGSPETATPTKERHNPKIPSGQYQSKPSGPLRIKKTKEKVKNQGPYARPATTTDVAANKTEKPLPEQHDRRDGPQERLTRLDFAGLIEDLQHTSSAQQEAPSTEPTIGVDTNVNHEAIASRRKLRPRIPAGTTQGGGSVHHPPKLQHGTGTESIRIVFKTRNEHGEWERIIHELVVDPSDPSSVERVARKDARNQKATFYDKDLRIITPAQCFDAAIEDEVNTIFITYGEELSVDEETVASVSRSLDADRERGEQAKRRRQ